MKSAFLYLLLVGVPLLGVLGILRVGERLAAPVAFDGAWQLELGATGEGCAPPGGPLRIAQSGRRAQVVMGAAAAAALEGSRLRTRVPLASGGPCAGWHVEAEAVGGAVPERLEGRLVPEGCACAPVPFHAGRAADAVGGSPH